MLENFDNIDIATVFCPLIDNSLLRLSSVHNPNPAIKTQASALCLINVNFVTTLFTVSDVANTSQFIAYV